MSWLTNNDATNDATTLCNRPQKKMQNWWRWQFKRCDRIVNFNFVGRAPSLNPSTLAQLDKIVHVAMTLLQRSSSTNVRGALILGCVLLSISNLVLLYIIAVDDTPSPIPLQPVWCQDNNMPSTHEKFTINLDHGRLDGSRKYKLFDNVAIGSNYIQLSKELNVTLVTQSSLDHLHWLAESLKTWEGPVSVAVFVPDIKYEAALLYIAKLRHCMVEIRNQVTFHFIYPVDRPPVSWVEAVAIDDDCLHPKNILDQILRSKRQVYVPYSIFYTRYNKQSLG